MKRFSILVGLILLIHSLYSQESPVDTTKNYDENAKDGLSLGGVPALAYDSDLGFLYGVILNFYIYEKEKYPLYNHSLYLEWSRTTKGSGKNIIMYDNRTLIPNGRMNLELSYLTEQALDFYGFNGYKSYFNPAVVDKESPEYISRLYYRHERKLLRFNADFEGKLYGKNLRWLAGFSNYNVNAASVDINELNDGKESGEQLPDTASLYDKYVEWNIIPQDQAAGGNTAYLKFGAVYDSRDIEASPGKGIWSEAIFMAAPSFFGNDYAYTKLILTHRQYLSLVPKKLVFAYRLNYQTKLSGDMPFYMLPFYTRSKDTKDGLGGSKTMRGILRNRVVGDAAALTNFELRYTFLRTVIAKQNFSITFSGFTDVGMVTKDYSFNNDGVMAGYGNTKQENLDLLNHSAEKPHYSYGIGLHFALNTNFIIAVDYGIAGRPSDGNNGLYILLDYIF